MQRAYILRFQKSFENRPANIEEFTEWRFFMNIYLLLEADLKFRLVMINLF